ncbi:hypothetical protein CcCBS67573_g10086 [Chytriomyces confervae]|uniref:Cache domain-containing protein n=1 Tax=Chytriomyces confervae TaxID=246404 RepID=A0A507DHZ7_9FUNG|nr:hypothetical protein CcCBS67573_g10086 [Chytriomyces confervae]
MYLSGLQTYAFSHLLNSEFYWYRARSEALQDTPPGHKYQDNTGRHVAPAVDRHSHTSVGVPPDWENAVNSDRLERTNTSSSFRIMGAQTDSNQGQTGSASRASEAIKSKFQGRSCSIPVLIVVFVQTFIVASLVLIIPLIIAFQSMTSANDLSTSTGRNLANSLAIKIQNIEGELALEKIGSLIQYVTENTLGIYKTLQANVDTNNLDQVLYSFANADKYTAYAYNMYFGSYDNGMILLQKSGPEAILTTMPVGFAESHPNCKLCSYYTQNFSKADIEWAVKRNTFSAVGGWNLDTWTYYGFGFANFTFVPSQRPWYKLAATQNEKNAQVMYTEPYLFAGSGAGQTGGATAGITAVIPLYDDKRFLRGVYGSDIAFTDMHATLLKMINTPNSFIYVMTRAGILIGTSTNESILDTTGNLKQATEAVHPLIHLTANFLNNKLGSGKSDYTTLEGSFEAQGMYFQLRALAMEPHFVIVNGAPKTDYTGDIDAVLEELDNNLRASVQKIIGISVAVFVVMVCISCVLTYFSVTVPLSKITTIMVQATSFDFTAFKAMEKQKGNFITELGTMEKVFYTMIEKFAQSIKANRELSGANNNNQASGLASQNRGTANNQSARKI